jgi:hypothetical protein
MDRGDIWDADIEEIRELARTLPAVPDLEAEHEERVKELDADLKVRLAKMNQKFWRALPFFICLAILAGGVLSYAVQLLMRYL